MKPFLDHVHMKHISLVNLAHVREAEVTILEPGLPKNFRITFVQCYDIHS